MYLSKIVRDIVLKLPFQSPKVAMRALGLLAAALLNPLVAHADPISDALYFESAGPDSFQNGLPINSFYDVPDPLPLRPAGTLIRADSTPFSGYVGNDLYGPISQLPAGVTAYRFVYHSRSSIGLPVASSGVILIPPGTAPSGGWPVIAWAHGTAGVARNCAPSAMKDIYYGDTDLYGFVNSLITSPNGTVFPKYAVVATDYTGLGTRFPHEYLSRKAQANDVIYSIPAARAALPGKLSRKWVVVGHSQGGQAALGVAELEQFIRDDNYLGAVSIAPLTYLQDTVKLWTNANIANYPGTLGYLPLVAHGVRTLFPWVQNDDLMTPAALNQLSIAPLLPPAPTPTTQLGCLYTASAAFGVFSDVSDVFRSGFNKGVNNGWLAAYSEINEPGKNRAFRPILVIQGEADEAIPVSTTDRAVNKLCHLGDRVYYKKYPLDPNGFYSPHTQVIYQSFDEHMAWIGHRFAGLVAPENCD